MLKKIIINLTPPVFIKIIKKLKNIFNEGKKYKSIKNYYLHGWYAGFNNYEEIKKSVAGIAQTRL